MQYRIPDWPTAGQPSPVIGADGNIVDFSASAGTVIDLTPVLDTTLYAAGKVLFTPVLLPGALTAANRVTLLQSIQALDKSATGPTIELMLFDSNPTSFGAANATMALSDADAAKEVGSYLIASTDWRARPNNKSVNPKNIGLEIKAASTDLYVAGWIPTGGTGGTFALGDLFLRFAFLQG